MLARFADFVRLAFLDLQRSLHRRTPKAIRLSALTAAHAGLAGLRMNLAQSVLGIAATLVFSVRLFQPNDKLSRRLLSDSEAGGRLKQLVSGSLAKG
ncbi:hypothetical protein Thiowin_01816 [Thiorhodovibrio winogradskyi]|uniref:Uncharacterized protein n=1 Tax=Thiorhodovibrio winogradskyi TaxID=77007 RepID=A0ABZ0SB77_9GAMM|nr:hypothetical protein [Thiorhodovibrio winogradskyi]